MAILGILLALIVDLLLPLGLLIWLAIGNTRYRRSNGSEAVFWGFLGLYAAWMALFVVGAIRSTLEFSGSLVYGAVFFSLPMSILPSVLNSTFVHYFFTTQEWSDFGYLIVLPTFLTGLLAWALLLPVLLRWLSQRESRHRLLATPSLVRVQPDLR